jgi:hypothetical protein
MKKTFLLSIVCASLFACSTPSENKADAAGTTTNTSSVTTEGPDVELMKKAGNAWAAGDWDTYLSCYADTARSAHNVWAVSTDTTLVRKMSSYIDQFKKSRESMDGNVSIDHGIYEVVTMADGSKYGHAWVDLSWKTKKGATVKSLLFNSFGIKDGKLTSEWPIYDSKPFTESAK